MASLINDETRWPPSSPTSADAPPHQVKELQRGDLPLHVNAAVLVRQDESRMDVWRALLSGPVDTPYALGLFAFDLFCPPEYPSIAPLVHLATTAGGTVKFNPNLYADGKVCLSLLGTFTLTFIFTHSHSQSQSQVCLSLLGTFNAGDASEKWDPMRSSLFQVLVSIQSQIQPQIQSRSNLRSNLRSCVSIQSQVLVSIQSQILTEEPIVNEPGYDEKHLGGAASREYNAKLRLHTMRHAMTAQLLRPPAGFEAAVTAHFTATRARVLRQCRRWTIEAPPELRPKMEAALAALHAALPPPPVAANGEAGAAASSSSEAPVPAAHDDDDGLYD
jgi:ubiquitin-protein ligase